MAAHNEAQHVADVVQRARMQGFTNVVVVDDGSKDATSELAGRAGATVLRHAINLGKGAAMQTGADYAMRCNATAIIFMDSDGQHLPEELPLFVEQLRKGYDLVCGARRRTDAMPIIRSLGNWAITAVVRLLYRLHLRDALSGFRAVRAGAYPIIRWDSRGYSVEGEMVARAGKNNLTYVEFTIATVYHDRYKGVTIVDGVKILSRLLWLRMTPLQAAEDAVYTDVSTRAGYEGSVPSLVTIE
jgi:glycosyltransferase involved in cell wall biosynthesis